MSDEQVNNTSNALDLGSIVINFESNLEALFTKLDRLAEKMDKFATGDFIINVKLDTSLEKSIANIEEAVTSLATSFGSVGKAGIAVFDALDGKIGNIGKQMAATRSNTKDVFSGLVNDGERVEGVLSRVFKAMGAVTPFALASILGMANALDRVVAAGFDLGVVIDDAAVSVGALLSGTEQMNAVTQRLARNARPSVFTHIGALIDKISAFASSKFERLLSMGVISTVFEQGKAFFGAMVTAITSVPMRGLEFAIGKFHSIMFFLKTTSLTGIASVVSEISLNLLSVASVTGGLLTATKAGLGLFLRFVGYKPESLFGSVVVLIQAISNGLVKILPSAELAISKFGFFASLITTVASAFKVASLGVISFASGIAPVVALFSTLTIGTRMFTIWFGRAMTLFKAARGDGRAATTLILMGLRQTYPIFQFLGSRAVAITRALKSMFRRGWMNSVILAKNLLVDAAATVKNLLPFLDRWMQALAFRLEAITNKLESVGNQADRTRAKIGRLGARDALPKNKSSTSEKMDPLERAAVTTGSAILAGTSKAIQTGVIDRFNFLKGVVTALFKDASRRFVAEAGNEMLRAANPLYQVARLVITKAFKSAEKVSKSLYNDYIGSWLDPLIHDTKKTIDKGVASVEQYIRSGSGIGPMLTRLGTEIVGILVNSVRGTGEAVLAALIMPFSRTNARRFALGAASSFGKVFGGAIGTAVQTSADLTKVIFSKVLKPTSMYLSAFGTELGISIRNLWTKAFSKKEGAEGNWLTNMLTASKEKLAAVKGSVVYISRSLKAVGSEAVASIKKSAGDAKTMFDNVFGGFKAGIADTFGDMIDMTKKVFGGPFTTVLNKIKIVKTVVGDVLGDIKKEIVESFVLYKNVIGGVIKGIWSVTGLPIVTLVKGFAAVSWEITKMGGEFLMAGVRFFKLDRAANYVFGKITSGAKKVGNAISFVVGGIAKGVAATAKGIAVTAKALFFTAPVGIARGVGRFFGRVNKRYKEAAEISRQKEAAKPSPDTILPDLTGMDGAEQIAALEREKDELEATRKMLDGSKEAAEALENNLLRIRAEIDDRRKRLDEQKERDPATAAMGDTLYTQYRDLDLAAPINTKVVEAFSDVMPKVEEGFKKARENISTAIFPLTKSLTNLSESFKDKTSFLKAEIQMLSETLKKLQPEFQQAEKSSLRWQGFAEYDKKPEELAKAKFAVEYGDFVKPVLSEFVEKISSERLKDFKAAFDTYVEAKAKEQQILDEIEALPINRRTKEGKVQYAEAMKVIEPQLEAAKAARKAASQDFSKLRSSYAKELEISVASAKEIQAVAEANQSFEPFVKKMAKTHTSRAGVFSGTKAEHEELIAAASKAREKETRTAHNQYVLNMKLAASKYKKNAAALKKHEEILAATMKLYEKEAKMVSVTKEFQDATAKGDTRSVAALEKKMAAMTESYDKEVAKFEKKFGAGLARRLDTYGTEKVLRAVDTRIEKFAKRQPVLHEQVTRLGIDPKILLQHQKAAAKEAFDAGLQGADRKLRPDIFEGVEKSKAELERLKVALAVTTANLDKNNKELEDLNKTYIEGREATIQEVNSGMKEILKNVPVDELLADIVNLAEVVATTKAPEDPMRAKERRSGLVSGEFPANELYFDADGLEQLLGVMKAYRDTLDTATPSHNIVSSKIDDVTRMLKNLREFSAAAVTKRGYVEELVSKKDYLENRVSTGTATDTEVIEYTKLPDKYSEAVKQLDGIMKSFRGSLSELGNLNATISSFVNSQLGMPRAVALAEKGDAMFVGLSQLKSRNKLAADLKAREVERNRMLASGRTDEPFLQDLAKFDDDTKRIKVRAESFDQNFRKLLQARQDLLHTEQLQKMTAMLKEEHGGGFKDLEKVLTPGQLNNLRVLKADLRSATEGGDITEQHAKEIYEGAERSEKMSAISLITGVKDEGELVALLTAYEAQVRKSSTTQSSVNGRLELINQRLAALRGAYQIHEAATETATSTIAGMTEGVQKVGVASRKLADVLNEASSSAKASMITGGLKSGKTGRTQPEFIHSDRTHNTARQSRHNKGDADRLVQMDRGLTSNPLVGSGVYTNYQGRIPAYESLGGGVHGMRQKMRDARPTGDDRKAQGAAIAAALVLAYGPEGKPTLDAKYSRLATSKSPSADADINSYKNSALFGAIKEGLTAGLSAPDLVAQMSKTIATGNTERARIDSIVGGLENLIAYIGMDRPHEKAKTKGRRAAMGAVITGEHLETLANSLVLLGNVNNLVGKMVHTWEDQNSGQRYAKNSIATKKTENLITSYVLEYIAQATPGAVNPSDLMEFVKSGIISASGEDDVIVPKFRTAGDKEFLSRVQSVNRAVSGGDDDATVLTGGSRQREQLINTKHIAHSLKRIEATAQVSGKEIVKQIVKGFNESGEVLGKSTSELLENITNQFPASLPKKGPLRRAILNMRKLGAVMGEHMQKGSKDLGAAVNKLLREGITKKLPASLPEEGPLRTALLRMATLGPVMGEYMHKGIEALRRSSDRFLREGFVGLITVPMELAGGLVKTFSSLTSTMAESAYENFQKPMKAFVAFMPKIPLIGGLLAKLFDNKIMEGLNKVVAYLLSLPVKMVAAIAKTASMIVTGVVSPMIFVFRKLWDTFEKGAARINELRSAAGAVKTDINTYRRLESAMARVGVTASETSQILQGIRQTQATISQESGLGETSALLARVGVTLQSFETDNIDKIFLRLVEGVRTTKLSASELDRILSAIGASYGNVRSIVTDQTVDIASYVADAAKLSDISSKTVENARKFREYAEQFEQIIEQIKLMLFEEVYPVFQKIIGGVKDLSGNYLVVIIEYVRTIFRIIATSIEQVATYIYERYLSAQDGMNNFLIDAQALISSLADFVAKAIKISATTGIAYVVLLLSAKISQLPAGFKTLLARLSGMVIMAVGTLLVWAPSVLLTAGANIGAFIMTSIKIGFRELTVWGYQKTLQLFNRILNAVASLNPLTRMFGTADLIDVNKKTADFRSSSLFTQDTMEDAFRQLKGDNHAADMIRGFVNQNSQNMEKVPELLARLAAKKDNESGLEGLPNDDLPSLLESANLRGEAATKRYREYVDVVLYKDLDDVFAFRNAAMEHLNAYNATKKTLATLMKEQEELESIPNAKRSHGFFSQWMENNSKILAAKEEMQKRARESLAAANEAGLLEAGVFSKGNALAATESQRLADDMAEQLKEEFSDATKSLGSTIKRQSPELSGLFTNMAQAASDEWDKTADRIAAAKKKVIETNHEIGNIPESLARSKTTLDSLIPRVIKLSNEYTEMTTKSSEFAAEFNKILVAQNTADNKRRQLVITALEQMAKVKKSSEEERLSAIADYATNQNAGILNPAAQEEAVLFTGNALDKLAALSTKRLEKRNLFEEVLMIQGPEAASVINDQLNALTDEMNSIVENLVLDPAVASGLKFGKALASGFIDGFTQTDIAEERDVLMAMEDLVNNAAQRTGSQIQSGVISAAMTENSLKQMALELDQKNIENLKETVALLNERVISAAKVNLVETDKNKIISDTVVLMRRLATVERARARMRNTMDIIQRRRSESFDNEALTSSGATLTDGSFDPFAEQKVVGEDFAAMWRVAFDSVIKDHEKAILKDSERGITQLKLALHEMGVAVTGNTLEDIRKELDQKLGDKKNRITIFTEIRTNITGPTMTALGDALKSWADGSLVQEIRNAEKEAREAGQRFNKTLYTIARFAKQIFNQMFTQVVDEFIKDLNDNLAMALSGVFGQASSIVVKGAMLAGTLIASRLESGANVMRDSVQDAVNSTEEIRGVISGSTTVALKEVSASMEEAGIKVTKPILGRLDTIINLLSRSGRGSMFGNTGGTTI